MKKVTEKQAKVNRATKTIFVEVPKETSKKAKVSKVSYLKEGVTGKQMMKAIYDANNAHKKDLGTFSQCLKRAIQFGSEEFTKTIAKFNEKDLTPRNLVPMRSERNKGKESFSVYEVLMMIKKFYGTK